MNNRFWQHPEINVTSGPFSVKISDGCKIADEKGSTILAMHYINLRGRKDTNEVHRTAHLIATAPEAMEEWIAFIYHEEKSHVYCCPLGDERFADDYGHIIAMIERTFPQIEAGWPRIREIWQETQEE